MGSTAFDEFNNAYSWLIFIVLALAETALVLYILFRLDKAAWFLLAMQLLVAIGRTQTDDLDADHPLTIVQSLLGSLSSSLFQIALIFFVFELKQITNVLQSDSLEESIRRRKILIIM